jgi:lipopolysaccharide export system permease protein
MNRIDRYVSGLFWAYFVGGLIVFVTIFLAIDALTFMVNYKGVAASAFALYYAYSAPAIVYMMAPVACLLATVFAISTLNRNNELVALYSIGMSLVRICAPILIWVGVISAGIFILSDKVLPSFASHKNYVFYHDIKKNPSLYSTVKNEKIWYRSKDTIFNIKTLNDQTHKAQGLTLYYFNNNWDLIQMITAKEVDLLGQKWNLKDGSVTLFTEDSSFPLTSQFQEKTIVMTEDAKDLTSTADTSDVMSLRELSQFIKKNKEAGLDTVRYEVSYDSKYGFAFAALVMSLLGIPFAAVKGRSGGTMLNMGICLGLILCYWILYSSALALGNYGKIPPLLAAWAPNILTLALGGFFIHKKRA